MFLENPNFPPNLTISPSSPQNELINSQEDQEDQFYDASAQLNAIEKYGIAGRVWEAAYVLDFYIRDPYDWEFDPPFLGPSSDGGSLTVIELGSGTGIIGSRIADLVHAGRDIVILTDLPEVCSLLEENTKRQLDNGTLQVRPLAWGDHEHIHLIASEFFRNNEYTSLALTRQIFGLTHIVCSDLVYFPELLAPLLRTLICLSSPPFVSPTQQGVTLVISYKIRSLSKETPFWSAFGLWFTFEPILARHKSSGSAVVDSVHWHRFGASLDGPVFIFIARRRPESFHWTVPISDEELLGGVGAWGTNIRKSDDTFESLLLMSMDNDE